MENLINFDDVNNKIITIRNENVILDSDVAKLYGVETMHINQAIKRNSDKFPEGYVFELNYQEKKELITIYENTITGLQTGVITICDNPNYTPCMTDLEKIKLSPTLPKAFTEKGLYMLATILKSPQATQTTIAIVEAFAKLRQLASNIAMLNSMDPEVIEPEIVESTGNLLNEVLFCGIPTSTETSFEINLGFVKAKRIVKSENSLNNTELEDLKRKIEKIEEKLKM
jgi:hypothetical protein